MTPIKEGPILPSSIGTTPSKRSPQPRDLAGERLLDGLYIQTFKRYKRLNQRLLDDLYIQTFKRYKRLNHRVLV